jgi:hypothetical protein
MLRWIAILFFVAGFAFAPARLASAALILDQIHDIQSHPWPDGFSDSWGATAWQTFTVGISGRLARVDLGVYSNYLAYEPLPVLITRLQNGSPDLTAMGVIAKSQLLPTDVPLSNYVNTDPPSWVGVDFSKDAPEVVSGQQLAIVLQGSSLSGYGYYWRIGEAGAVDYYPVGGLFGDFGNTDAHFRTFVEVVPEPTACVIAGAAISAVAAGCRRHQK